jgi:hypothetical protein
MFYPLKLRDLEIHRNLQYVNKQSIGEKFKMTQKKLGRR